MTEEIKKLVLKDLSARVPYGVKVWYPNGFGAISTVRGIVDDICYFNENPTYGNFCHIEQVKPYLRSLSSMTEEEKEDLKQEHIKDEKIYAEVIMKAANGDSSMRGKAIPHFAADWCNKYQFDYRGLIPMGLALEATEGMYNKK